MTWQIVIETSAFAKMETQTVTQNIETDDTSMSKNGDIAHHENEKALSDSPVESVNPDAEHVTAKTWLVIFVSLLSSVHTGHIILMTKLRSFPRPLVLVSGLFQRRLLC